ncbi:MAG: FAD-binding protein [Bacteriovoracaceae bacterium]|jgi:2-polyprenyl-6-methoxyphenol hydroxylase-like FAD-dependent oxidoreductase|nr:FAD-binding protein [Bacteriovoracaceae bacterium]
MINKEVDIVVVGAGPVGLMCTYLGTLCGISMLAIDKSEAPLKVGRADALNARTLQLLELVDLFDDLYQLGKICNTSSVWADGKFISRESSWWEQLEGCLHKHFLMLGQYHIEKLLDEKLKQFDARVLRGTTTEKIEVTNENCITTLSNGDKIKSKYVIGADGARSFVRKQFNISFDIVRPQIIWAVIDGVIETDFPKVPEIIVFQTDTSDVAWIPREGKIDRFYVRMEKKKFTQEEIVAKINHAIKPHSLKFKEIVWFLNFSVKESVASSFFFNDRIFLAGDSCHIHSVNGGQGLNTGLADAFNLIWKLNMTLKGASSKLLATYEAERMPVAQSVIETSAELVRSTKYSKRGSHAQDYVEIVKKRAGNITGMGIRYGQKGLVGARVFDFEIFRNKDKTRLYSLLNYRKYTLLIHGGQKRNICLPDFINLIHISLNDKTKDGYWTNCYPYKDQVVLIRPDSYIQAIGSFEKIKVLIKEMFLS